MRVKVCGMRDAGNMKEIAELRPNYMGFIFYPRSSRYCGGMDPEIIRNLPEDIEPVMVTVDMLEEQIMEIAPKYGFRTVQLHGSEDPEACRALRKRGMKVIKAVGVSTAESLENLERYKDQVDLFLLDTSCPEKGGSGKKFNWDLLTLYDLDKDFMLSGGIGPDDAEAIAGINHPHFIGIDLNSRFELSPGMKNVDALRKFLEALPR